MFNKVSALSPTAAVPESCPQPRKRSAPSSPYKTCTFQELQQLQNPISSTCSGVCASFVLHLLVPPSATCLQAASGGKHCIHLMDFLVSRTPTLHSLLSHDASLLTNWGVFQFFMMSMHVRDQLLCDRLAGVNTFPNLSRHSKERQELNVQVHLHHLFLPFAEHWLIQKQC